MQRRRLTGPEKKRIAAACGWRCQLCHLLLPSTYHIDHIVPLSEGGADDATNCWSLCQNCHAIKTEGETIERLRRSQLQPHARTMTCSRCGRVCSPYFIHAC